MHRCASGPADWMDCCPVVSVSSQTRLEVWMWMSSTPPLAGIVCGKKIHSPLESPGNRDHSKGSTAENDAQAVPNLPSAVRRAAALQVALAYWFRLKVQHEITYGTVASVMSTNEIHVRSAISAGALGA